MIQLYQGDCLDIMPTLDVTVDMVLADPPYGTTACKWDSIIPLEPMWKELKRLTKKNGAIVMTASQPFTSVLVCSNVKSYKHHWVWEKEKGTGFQVAKHRPMMKTEDVVSFCAGSLKYNPQMTERETPIRYKYPSVKSKSNPIAHYNDGYVVSNEKYPENIIRIKTERGLHPTQKPVALMEYMIKTYTNEGDTVLDFTMGSGTTGVACKKLNRNFIGIEKDPEYFKIAEKRINDTYPDDLFDLPPAA